MTEEQQRWNDFWEWVDRERLKRRLSWNELEFQGGVSSSSLHHRYKHRKPLTTFGQAEAIARGLGVPLDDVLVEAGVLEPAEQSERESLRVMVHRMRQLTPRERKELLDYATFRFNLRRDLDPDSEQ